MAQRSTRGRLGQSGGDKSMHELLAAGRQWEAMRAGWYAQAGNWQMSQECAGRQRHYERELDAYLAELQ